MRRIHRVFIALLLLALGIAGGVEYLNRAVLPVKARAWAEQSLSEALGRKVSIGRIKLHVWHGFVADDLRIEDASGPGQEALLHVDQISGGILFLPLLRKNQVVIPILHIHGPSVRLTQGKDGRWNIEDLKVWKPAPPPPPAGRRMQILIPRLRLTRGRLSAKFQGAARPPDLYFQEIQGEMHLSLPAKAEGSLSAELRLGDSAPSQTPVKLKAQAAYDRHTSRLKAQSQSTWPLTTVALHLPKETRARLKRVEGTAEVDLELSGAPPGPWDFRGRLATQHLRCEMEQPFQAGWEGEVPPALELKGDLQMKLDAQLPSFPVKEPWKNLEGTLLVNQFSAGPLPYVQEIQQLGGEIRLTPEGIRTEKMIARLSSGTPLEISGSVQNDGAGTFAFRAQSAFPLDQPPPLPLGATAFTEMLQMKGEANLEVSATGSLRPRLSVQPSATLKISEASLKLPQERSVHDLQGLIRWQPELLTVSSLTGTLQNKPFRLEGTLVNFEKPEIDARASWGELEMEGQIAVSERGKNVEIQNLNGRLGSGTFRLLGEVAFPAANLYGEAAFRWEELYRLWPGGLPWIQKNSLQGETSLRCQMQGDLNALRECNVDLKATSPSLSIRDIPLKQVSIELKQERGEVHLPAAKATLADGTILVSAQLSRSDGKLPWRSQVSVDGVDLEKLASLLKWNAASLSGRLSGAWQGKGQALDLAALSGDGTLQVTGAQVLELPLLGPFADVINLPSLRKIAFQEAEGSFRVGGGEIRTDRFEAKSPQAVLHISGKGGFLNGADSPIRWRILPTLTGELIPEEGRSRLGRVIAKGTTYLVGEIQITGTWKNPVRKFISKPVSQILDEQLFNLQDLVGEVF